MNQNSIAEYIGKTFADAQVATGDGNLFFFRGPDRKVPFATLVTNDLYDQVSNLERPDVFRLNVGVSKETFRNLFSDASTATFDFTALDEIMPHPVYGNMCWVCVLSPSDATFERVKELLAESYDRAAKRGD